MEKSILNLNSTEKTLFWASVLLLFGEIIAIRWLSIEIPPVQVFPNLILLTVLVSASAGVGNPRIYKLKAIFVVAAVVALLVPVIFSVQLGVPLLSIKQGVPTAIGGPSIAVLLGLIAALVAIFVNVGSILGEGFSSLPPLRAYAINLLGSVAGVALVAIIALFFLPPPVWILLCGLICWQVRPSKLVPIVTVLAMLPASFTTHNSHWSPYSKLDIVPLGTREGSILRLRSCA